MAERHSERSKRDTSAADYQRALDKIQKEKFVLRLYITGMTPRSQRAIQNVRKLCEEHLCGHYELQVIDIYQEPDEVKSEEILAAPTLIKKLPLPLRKLIGDMSKPDRILVSLGIKPHSK